ncbi:30S ribosomal protein S6 [Candidatus Phytoplasma sacchari]|uniref:Small ribosomal subunit protein bS6 n=1 Tax=Candidatus Phytoplasma sacchari TaxID=2609813 RepID=A0ABY7M1B2_9MOLU|nr:30S ribosomal protein S6 [Candidatus Phytoplasma sacchari]
MKRYEIMYVLNPTLSDEKIKSINSSIRDIFLKKGKILEYNKPELKEISYPIKKFKEGFYNSLLVLANNQDIEEFNHKVNVTEEIIRFILINREGKKYDKQSYFSGKDN